FSVFNKSSSKITMATAAAAASNLRDRDDSFEPDLMQPDPWADGQQQFSLLDAPCPQQLIDANRNGNADTDDEDDDAADGGMPAGGRDVHDWTMEAPSPASPQEMLDASLKMLFRSPEKIVDLRRIIAHLAEADALLHQGETAGGTEAAPEKWQPLKLQHPQARQKQQQQQQVYQNMPYTPPQQNRELERLRKENEELKSVNKQWHEFWSSQKARHEKMNEDRDRQLAELRNQLAQARSAPRVAPPLPPPPPPLPQPNDPTDSLISDTTEAMRRLERERTRLADELARANRELEGLRQENEVLQAQAALYQEDFARERADRESAQARLAELRDQLGQAPAAAAGAVAAAPAPVGPPGPADRRAFMQQRQMQQQQQLLATTVGADNRRNNSNNNDSASAICDQLPESHNPVRRPGAAAAATGPAGPWKCEACTLENPATAHHCSVCDRAKPYPAQNPYLL
ncbi:hypothetical protein BOX15_Mlig033996g4, partial [Macrostomum lignano]